MMHSHIFQLLCLYPCIYVLTCQGVIFEDKDFSFFKPRRNYESVKSSSQYIYFIIFDFRKYAFLYVCILLYSFLIIYLVQFVFITF